MSSTFSALIVDDSSNKSLMRVVSDELNITEVMRSTNTIDALNMIGESENINLVFLDFETTLDKTFPFVQSAKATGNCVNTKFFLLANHSDKKFLSEAAKNGISAFILKPFKDKKLIEKANKLLPKIEKQDHDGIELLESIEATLRYKGKEITGDIKDINSRGCIINTRKLGHMKIEIFDVVTIKINFEDKKLGINAEVVKMEKDRTKDYKGISTTFKFKKPDEDNAMQFAEFWAYILKERESI